MSRPAKIALMAACIAGAFIAGRQSRSGAPQAATAGGIRILYYHDPMHPAYRSQKPGIAPDCGMQLVPVFAGDRAAPPPSPDLPAGSIEISLERQQLIGVRVAEAQNLAATHIFRVLGRVATDETRIYRINAATDGWIRQTFANSTGSLVQKNESLVTFYSREFLSAEQAYLYALDRLQASAQETPDQGRLPQANIQQSTDSLRNLGMGDLQIEEIKRTRQLTQSIKIHAPATAFVLSRNVSPGQRFEKGAELYRLADLSRIWVLADQFENEARLIKPGQSATVKYQGRTWRARMSDVLPQFDPATRTLKVRFEVENPGYALRPDMFVDVAYPVQLPQAVTVPVDAVIDSGLKKTVYVERGSGVFEPRQVETGWRFGDQVAIVNGLEAGERVVVSGNFLIDSESRMKLAAWQGKPEQQQAAAAPKDPVCGMDLADTSKAASSEHQGKTYYFCSDSCKKKFDGSPAAYSRAVTRDTYTGRKAS